MTTAPPLARADERARQLRAMKRRATGLLVVVAAAFVAVATLGTDTGWAGYARAGLEGSLVGGLADWFAVTALFRHPLGLPIPHTAVIRGRKDQFGQTLGAFVQENFLGPDVVGERVRAARVGRRAAGWLRERRNAELVARYAGELAVALADVVRDEDVQRVLHREAGQAIARLPLADAAAGAIRLATAEGRHQLLLDALLRGLDAYLVEHRDDLRARFGTESPWWLPGAVEDRVFERLLDGVTRLLHAVNEDPDHEVRREFDARVAAFADELETSPELRDRVDELRDELLAHPALRAWSGGLWTDVKQRLRDQAGDPESALRRRLTDGVCALGSRVDGDPSLVAKLDEVAERAVRVLTERFHDELAALVSGTIERWDGQETSDKLELLLGRDLQFIRINGTVVGGLAGLAIHAVTLALA